VGWPGQSHSELWWEVAAPALYADIKHPASKHSLRVVAVRVWDPMVFRPKQYLNDII
jgi:hypothetical protein